MIKRKGVTYDVGSVMSGNWRPIFDPEIINRELQIIKNDLNCNAVRITGYDINRLIIASKDALKQGLEVWLSPTVWDKSPRVTIDYITKAASAAEKLRVEWPELVFLVGGESTLFMRGIIPGKTLMKRLKNMSEIVRAGKHNKPLNKFLNEANMEVRKVFHGKVTYASLIWEQVDWSIFDFVGVDHYWDERIGNSYLDMLKTLFSYGKPVNITEFGFGTSQAPLGGVTDLGNVEDMTFILHRLPIVGRFIRVRVKKIYERDEGLQARRLFNQLKCLDKADVDGTFINTFVFPIKPYDENPRYDLDRESPSLVKSYTRSRHGITYTDMTWEPKESFKTVADYYAK